MSIATASDFEIAPARPLVAPLLLAAGCVALADWLFYGWEIARAPCSALSPSPHSENWRAWSFRTWRLKRYLATNPDIPLTSTDSGKG
jgi:hypothetical protein